MKLKYNFTSLYKQNQAVLLKINGRLNSLYYTTSFQGCFFLFYTL